MLEFPRRPRHERTLASQRRIWTSRCGRYRVVHSHCLYGGGVLSDVFYAQAFDPSAGAWDILPAGRHRKLRPAFEHCQREARSRRVEG